MESAADLGVRRRDRTWSRLDLSIALVLVAVGVAESFTTFHETAVPSAAVLTAVAAPVAWRRTRPLAALVATMAATLASAGVEARLYESLAMATSVSLVIYSVAAWEGAQRAVAGLVVALAAMPVALLAEDATINAQLAITLECLVVWAVGRAVRAQREQVRRSAEAAFRAELDVGQVEIDAVLGERARMGRELHDIVSHGLSAMVVQATVTSALAAERPDAALRALDSIQEIGRRTEREVHRFLELLRRGHGGEQTPAAPNTTASNPAAFDRARLPASSWWPPRGVVADGVFAAAAAVAVIGELVAIGQTEIMLIGAGLMQSIPLRWRRTAPLPALAIVLAGTVIAAPLRVDTNIGLFCLVVVVYSCAAWEDRRNAAIALVTTMAVTVALGALFRYAVLPVWPLLNVVVPWSIGRAMRANLHAVADATDRQMRIEAEAARRTASRLDVDRLRLARELHDIVSHGIAVMVVQAAAARGAGPASSPFVEGALQCIQDVGRATLGEIGCLLELLGTPSVDNDLEPVPDIADIEALVGRVRRSGLPVTLRVDGDPFALPPGVGVTAYRIVQEALTNVGRHANHAATDVSLVFDIDQLEITVRNEAGIGSSTVGSGQGLIGIRERVAVCHGDVEMGRVDDGAFVISAKLPTT